MRACARSAWARDSAPSASAMDCSSRRAPASDGRVDQAALLRRLQLQKIAAQALGKALQFLEVPLFLATQPAVNPKHMVKGSH